MAFKMKGYSPFTKMDEKTAKEKYEKAVKAGETKPRYFKKDASNLRYPSLFTNTYSPS